jgi:DNA repair protein RAD50
MLISPQVAHLQGELASHKAQLKTLESDLKEFRDINKRYRDQLIKVKVGIYNFIEDQCK